MSTLKGQSAGGLDGYTMWIVQVALKRPYTFIVLAFLIAIFGSLSAVRTPTDIFPSINIPVVSVVWTYSGLLGATARGGAGGAPRQIRASAGNHPQYPTSSPPGVLVASIELIACIEDSSCPETMRAHIE
jgi:hypothetical protein